MLNPEIFYKAAEISDADPYISIFMALVIAKNYDTVLPITSYLDAYYDTIGYQASSFGAEEKPLALLFLYEFFKGEQSV